MKHILINTFNILLFILEFQAMHVDHIYPSKAMFFQINYHLPYTPNYDNFKHLHFIVNHFVLVYCIYIIYSFFPLLNYFIFYH